VAGKRSDRGSALRLGTSERFLGVPPRSTEYRSKRESLINQAAAGVGQGTEDNCLRVSSLIFIRTGCDNRPLEVCSIAHIFS
jgi:hypothetical protein